MINYPFTEIINDDKKLELTLEFLTSGFPNDDKIINDFKELCR